MNHKIWLVVLLSLFVLFSVGCAKDEGDDDEETHKHVWIEADCEKPKHCKKCGETEGAPLGHDWIEATCTEAKHCARCGKTEGSTSAHVWVEATCTEPQKCSVCGATRGRIPGHDVPNATCLESVTCARCGQVIPAPGHAWAAASCTEPKHCIRCGETEGEPLGHVWVDATCLIPKNCTRCNAREGETIPHEWREATCTEPRTCVNCGIKDGSALGHTFIRDTCIICGAKDPNYVPPETFEDNKYYQIVEEAQYTNSIGYTILVKKVLARQNVQVSATLLAYDSNGDVIGKSSDDIILTAGEVNYFSFSFEQNISKAKIETSYKSNGDSWSAGDRDAVEMVKYNQSGDNLYITFKQVKENLGSFAKYKLLFYKGDKIVGTEWGYYSISVENLSGKDTTDVAEIWVYNKKFDKIEFIFEP